MLYYFTFDRLEDKSGSGVLYAIHDRGFWRYSMIPDKLINLVKWYKVNEYYYWDLSGNAERMI